MKWPPEPGEVTGITTNNRKDWSVIFIVGDNVPNGYINYKIEYESEETTNEGKPYESHPRTLQIDNTPLNYFVKMILS